MSVTPARSAPAGHPDVNAIGEQLDRVFEQFKVLADKKKEIYDADIAALMYFLALNSFYALLLILAIPEIWRHWQMSEDSVLQRLLMSDALPAVSILVPAHNEDVTITARVLSFLNPGDNPQAAAALIAQHPQVIVGLRVMPGQSPDNAVRAAELSKTILIGDRVRYRRRFG